MPASGYSQSAVFRFHHFSRIVIDRAKMRYYLVDHSINQTTNKTIYRNSPRVFTFFHSSVHNCDHHSFILSCAVSTEGCRNLAPRNQPRSQEEEREPWERGCPETFSEIWVRDFRLLCCFESELFKWNC